MTIQEALKTGKAVVRPNRQNIVAILHKAGTGPNFDLVDCDYFLINELDHEDKLCQWYFSTSLDLYPEDLFADDWEIYEP